MDSPWPLRTLNELASYHNGRAFKPNEWKEAGLPIIRIAQITNQDAPGNYFDGSDVDPRHFVDTGDLLFSWSATLAVRKWRGGPAVLNQHIFKVVERDGVSKDFLRYRIEHSIPALAESSHGSTMRHIRKGVLREHRATQNCDNSGLGRRHRREDRCGHRSIAGHQAWSNTESLDARTAGTASSLRTDRPRGDSSVMGSGSAFRGRLLPGRPGIAEMALPSQRNALYQYSVHRG